MSNRAGLRGRTSSHTGMIRFGDGFEDPSLQTIEITTKLSEMTDGSQFLTWLQANATKQSS